MDPPACTPPESLVKYESPHFVSEEGELKEGDSSALDKVLNSMLPPREWIEGESKWMQFVSKKAATRLDVIELQELLEKRLVDRQARLTGICPVREDLFSQVFDELIRQIALDGHELGLLLLRVRDEIRMTIDAYETLYESSVAFGVRKQLEAEQGMGELEQTVLDLEEEKRQLQQKVLQLKSGVEVVEKREIEHKAVQDKKRKEEIDYLKYQGQHLDAFLRNITNTN